MSDICSDCEYCKNQNNGEGVCKFDAPHTNFMVGKKRYIRRDNGWPIVDINAEPCGKFEHA